MSVINYLISSRSNKSWVGNCCHADCTIVHELLLKEFAWELFM